MFTGIIEESGSVTKLIKAGSGARLIVEARGCASDTRIGDSISINGVCLTAVDIDGSLISFDVSSETLERTGTGVLVSGARVNIERALKADSRLGGHFVTGHIDCMGKILSSRAHGEFLQIKIGLPQRSLQFLTQKGSVSVDGISLTVNSVGQDSFDIFTIPHTLKMTTLGHKMAGDPVNIETDILAKYIARLMKRPEMPGDRPSNITTDLLKDHGFI